MVNEQRKAAAPSRTLRVLLLICAGALIVIIATIASAIDEAHSIHVAQDTERFCGMTVAQFQALPTALQYRMNALCC